jgi:uncharacterized protein YggE
MENIWMIERLITVRGTGTVSTKPDLIVITLDLALTEKDNESALKRATTELNFLRAALMSVGHDSEALKTTNFTIQTAYEDRKLGNEWIKQFVGYTCTHALRLEFDLDLPMLGKTLGAITKCQTTPQFDIAFSIKNPAAIRTKLLEEAVTNAVEKARILAKAAGVKLGMIQQIDYSWNEIRLSSHTAMNMCYGSAADAPGFIDMTPDDIDVNDTVTVVWAIE